MATGKLHKLVQKRSSVVDDESSMESSDTELKLVVQPKKQKHMEEKPEEEKPGVAVVLPRWGGGMGGIYSLSHSLVHQLRKDGRSVVCVLGATVDQLTDGEIEHMRQLGLKILHPNTEDEDTPRSPEDRLKLADLFDEMYEEVLPCLNNVEHILTFSEVTSELADYLQLRIEGSQLVILSHQLDRSPEEIIVFADSARSAQGVFLLGHSAFRSFNSDIKVLSDAGQVNSFRLTPDYQFLFPASCQLLSGNSREEQNRVFIPRIAQPSDEFIKHCICAVQSCNETLMLTGQMENMIALTVQNHNVDDFMSCSYKDHTHHIQKFATLTTTTDIACEAKRAGIVLASGQFSDAGFSGLEFLMNGIVTLVPEGSDVAEILMEASPGFANIFLLSGMTGLLPQQMQTALSEWQKKIHATLRGKTNLTEKLAVLIADLRKHPTFKRGQKHLMENLGGTVKTETGMQSALFLSTIMNKLGETTLIGSGSFSNVYKLDDRTAVKVIPVAGRSINKASASKEIKIMGHLCSERPHDHIIGFYGCHFSPQSIYILMELGIETMDQFMRKAKYRELTDVEKRDILKQLFTGLKNLHHFLIVHQDLKHSNILFTGPHHIKISDFGTAKIKTSAATTQATTSSENPGTPYYQAPEVLFDGKRAQPYSDVWSGCLVGVEWFSGKQCWKTTGPRGFMLMKQKHEMPGQLSKIPEGVRGVLVAGLNYTEKKRPMAREIKAALDYQDALTAFLQKYPEVWTEILEQPEVEYIMNKGRIEEMTVAAKIEIHNFSGEAAVVVSCVTTEKPPKPHPYQLIGEYCRQGVCTVNVTDMTVSFPNIGMQCVMRKDIRRSLKDRKAIEVDPYGTGCDYYITDTALKELRLCFQVFLRDANGVVTKKVNPVSSNVIYVTGFRDTFQEDSDSEWDGSSITSSVTSAASLMADPNQDDSNVVLDSAGYRYMIPLDTDKIDQQMMSDFLKEDPQGLSDLMHELSTASERNGAIMDWQQQLPVRFITSDADGDFVLTQEGITEGTGTT